MKEIKTILNHLHTTTETGQQTALATVVNVYGSSYRKTGARMLIREDGRWFGSVSGGCLEGDVIEKARKVMHSGKTTLHRYDTRLNAKNAFGMGYGCNGLLEILIEPIAMNDENNAFFSLKKVTETDQGQALATVYSSEDEQIAVPGQRLHSTGRSTITHPLLSDQAQDDLQKCLISHESMTKKYLIEGKTVKVLFEYFDPPLHILVYGAVHHAVPLTNFARELGHEVHITDVFEPIQPVWNFEGSERIRVIEPGEMAEMFRSSLRLAVVYLTHNFMFIKETLPEVLRSAASYVGILGSRKKTEKILKEAQVDEAHFSREELAKIHYPVGLDIGAVTPEEIALSIMAEITAVFSTKKSVRQSLNDAT